MTSINKAPEYAQALAGYSTTIDDLINDIDPQDWEAPSPAPGWTVRDQLAHLSFIYHIANLAVRDAQAFASALSAAPSMQAAIDNDIRRGRDLALPDLVDNWRGTRDRCVEAFAAANPGELVPWLVNPLPPAVLAAAGIMETFAHGLDIADALGERMPDSPALAHVVAFAVKVRDFGYEAHGLTPPSADFRFEISAMGGNVLTFGDENAEDYVIGSAYDFCQVVTRRRHHQDTDVVATGPHAPTWLTIAQSYRGNPGTGRQPGQFESARSRAA